MSMSFDELLGVVALAMTFAVNLVALAWGAGKLQTAVLHLERTTSRLADQMTELGNSLHAAVTEHAGLRERVSILEATLHHHLDETT